MAEIRYDWTVEEVEEILSQPFNDLLFRAQTVHREFMDDLYCRSVSQDHLLFFVRCLFTFCCRSDA